MSKLVKKRISENIDLGKDLLEDDVFCSNLCDIAYQCVDVLKNGRRIFFAGNGGSCAQSQHLAAELSGRFLKDRPPLDVLNLSDNVSFLTAVSNDYSYDQIYARALKAHGKAGDLLFLLSTSGNSQNILTALKTANELKIHTVSMTGINGEELSNACNLSILIPSAFTAKIQEMHLLCGHIICEIVEKKIFG